MEIETSNDPVPTNPPGNSSPPRPSNSANKDQFQVERIVDKRIQNGQKLYLIKWEGFPDSECTWEPVENLLSVLDLIVDYEVRDCIKDPNQEEEQNNEEQDPSVNTKRAATHDLSDDEGSQKKLKTETENHQDDENGDEDDEDDDDEDDEDDDEDDHDDEEKSDQEDSIVNYQAIDLLRRKRKYLQTLKAFQPDTFENLETFKEIAQKIILSKPFNLETVDYQDLELKFPKYGERIALTDVGLKKRGRPKKIIDPETEAANKELSLIPKKRGRPSKKLLKLLKKRGRPRKSLTDDDDDDDDTQPPIPGADAEPKKRGRPRKVVEYDQTSEHPSENQETLELKEGQEGGDHPVEIEGEPGTVGEEEEAKKRGRPKKTPSKEETEHAMEEEKNPGAHEEGERPLRKRGRPRKDQTQPQIMTENIENANENEISALNPANPLELTEIDMEKFVEIEEEEEEESEEEERVGDEDYNPTAKAKTKRSATLKQENKAKAGEPQDGVQKRGRGRPRKSQTIVSHEEPKKESNQMVVEAVEGDHQQDQTAEEIQKQTTEPEKDENGEVKQENEGTTQAEENTENPTALEGSAEIQVRKRGRPPKNKTETIDNQPKRGRGRPPKHSNSQQHTDDHPQELEPHQDQEDSNHIEDDQLDLNVPIKRKRGRPKKNVEDVDKENEYTNENQQNKDSTDFAEKTERAASTSPDFNILAQKVDHQKISPEPTSRAMFYKDGNLEAKDKPKKISKVRIVPGGGGQFLVEWEPRANGEQPKTSYVSSNEFKNYNPVFLIDYYENLIRENLKENGQENLIKSITEELIPVEPTPEQFGSLAFHDKPKEVITVQSINESGCEFLVRWHERFNSEQPLDSMVNSDSFKAHDPSFLLKYYETRLKPKSTDSDAVFIDLPELSELTKQNETLKEDSLKDMNIFDASNVGIQIDAEFQKDMESSRSNTLTGNE